MSRTLTTTRADVFLVPITMAAKQGQSGIAAANSSLNTGEVRNALALAAFFNRLGELRDRSHENQRQGY